MIDTYLKIKHSPTKCKVFDYLDENLVYEGKMEKNPTFIGFTNKIIPLFELNAKMTISLLKNLILYAEVSHLVLESLIMKFQAKPDIQL